MTFNPKQLKNYTIFKSVYMNIQLVSFSLLVVLNDVYKWSINSISKPYPTYSHTPKLWQYKILSNTLLLRLTPYIGKSLGIISEDFHTTKQLLIMYSVFIRYWRRKGSTIWQYTSHLQTSRKPTISSGGKYYARVIITFNPSSPFNLIK